MSRSAGISGLFVLVTVCAVTWAGVPPPARAEVATCQGEVATILGTDSSETINGTSGDDVIAAGDGADTVNGGGGNDVICGGDGDDVLHGDDGEIDLLSGDAGNDLIDGGPGGTDGAVFAYAPGPVTASLSTGTASGQGTDTLTDVEGLVGSEFDNHLSGDGAAFNWFAGVPGNDVIDGGSGFDAVFYTFATGPVTVDLTQGEASGEGNDTLASIEAVSGGSYDDTLVGNDAVNILSGREGNDTMNGRGDVDVLSGDPGDDGLTGGTGEDTLFGGPGNDAFDGGGDSDVVAYSGAPDGVTASLVSGRAFGEGKDRLTAVEALSGSAYADVLIGDSGSNRLGGQGGNDVLLGLGGNDMLSGGDGTDKGHGSAGDDFCDVEKPTSCEQLPGQGLPGTPPPPPALGPLQNDSASTLVGTGQRAGAMAGISAVLSESGSAAANDLTFGVVLDVERPVCYTGFHQTSLKVTAFAKGSHYTAYLVYWTGSRWVYSGYYIGPMSQAYIYVPGFIGNEFVSGPAYYLWSFDAGGQVDTGDYWQSVAPFGTYWAWAETYIDAAGSRVTQFMGDHETISSTGVITYNWYCRLY